MKESKFFIKVLNLFFICISYISYSQSSYIYNKWVLQKTITCLQDSTLDDTKWNIKFRKDSIAEISFSNIKDKIEQKFSMVSNEIIINEETYVIDTLLDDTLILRYNLNNICEKLVFKSEKWMFDNQLKNYVMYNNEPVYFANELNHPNLKGYNELKEYFKNAYSEKAVDKDYCDIKFIFIVTKDGKLEKERGNISCLKKSDRLVKKIFEGTKDKWEPMLINNKAVNAYVEIKFQFKYNQIELDKNSSMFMSRFEMRNLIIRHRNTYP